ncbi:MAG: 3-isopropylmalate dehydratase small subunit [Candidatus Bathyarchaeota archaeon]|nr:3-isopropylmalate dehydratase small subunit [Candidatus Bathyarchaeota archaeon]MCX8176724.1 3-isopropylmalate dehydratase small subunit [Candidatus Bathyarchaeota archaeon]MDW8193252.1 3-isopropylmalate dehydratase small subunit [Nitrososphaerota archaeon]
MIISGKAVKFSDNVDTDVIIPSKYLVLLDPNELARHAMEGLDPGFYEKARRGVILAAGKNFGCGSSREQAPIALKYAGVKCVIAESFARIFYRNAINIGLPVIECENVSGRIADGDELMVDLENGFVKNLTKNATFQATKLPPFIMQILKDGGLIENLRRRLGVK